MAKLKVIGVGLSTAVVTPRSWKRHRADPDAEAIIAQLPSADTESWLV